MTDKQHDFTATEIKAGTLVLVSIVILVGFVAAIRGCRPRDETAKIYHVSFSDIAGLNHRADVRFGGVIVGRVVGIEPDPADRSRIRVTVEVRGEIPVNQGSVASVAQVSLTTEKHLEISTGEHELPLLDSGDTLRSRSGGGFIDIPNLEEVTVKLEILLDSVIALLGVEQAREEAGTGEPELVDLAQLMADLDATIHGSTGTVHELGAVISENRAGFQEIVTKLIELEETATELMANMNDLVAENRPPLKSSVENLNRLTTEATAQIEELAATLQSTLRHLQDVGGNTSDLIEDQRLTLEEILRNLEETTGNLSEFSRTLAERPEALIRGKGAQGRKNGEAR
jgi:phospholipid/cholesterol/gamma-HCH transport system substrate-binding protein